MYRWDGWQRLVGTVVLSLTLAATTEAARLRFHYVPADPSGRVAFKPGPCVGEHVTALRVNCDNCPPRPNCWKAFCHPCSGRPVTVPLALPVGTPTIYHKTNAVQFNYGSYFVQVNFLPDGSVDVVYSSGFLREI